jgi:hypothetical protein
MDNKNKSAFATAAGSHYLQEGLTKREYMATHILTGVVAAGNDADSRRETFFRKNKVKYAIKLTDELLKQLNQ